MVRVGNWEMEREKNEGNMESHFLPEVLIFGSLASIQASSNKRKKIRVFDLSFIWKPSGRGTSWHEIH
jgi:hypothetical protein